MSNQEEILTVENDHARVIGEAYNRLKQNPDFKLVIEQEYLTDSVLNSASLLAVPQVKKRGERPEVMEDLIAASNLKYFFHMVETSYEGVVNPVLSSEEEAELEAGGA